MMYFLLILILFSTLSIFGGMQVVAQSDSLPSIIFVKQAPVDFTVGTIADIFNNVVGHIPSKAQPVGGGLFRLDPDGMLSNLTPMGGIAVRDPEISYDGLRVIFSMKRGAFGVWQIYEMNVDGTNMRQISNNGAANDWDPVYLPNGSILFVSDRLQLIAKINENIPEGQLPEGMLFQMDAEGRNIEPINVNPQGTFEPQVGYNGLIYFTQWDLNDLRGDPNTPADGISISRFLIWETFLDGSREGHPIFGTHIIQDFAGGFTDARELPDGSGDMIATLTQSQYTWGAGSIVKIAPRGDADLQRIEWLTPSENYTEFGEPDLGRYRSPYPLSNGKVIASYAAGTVFDDGQEQVPDFDLVLLDQDGGHKVIHADPDFWDWQAVEVAPRPLPEIAESPAIPGYPLYAIVNAKDVELRHRNADDVLNGDSQPAIAPGEAAVVRIYALDRPPAPYAGGDSREQGLLRRFLGEAPVAEDGSFAAAIPARTLLQWEVVNEAGDVLVTERAWSEFAPGEVRTCNGCHSPHDGTTGRTTNLALMNPINLTSFDVDMDDNGQIDLVEDYFAANPELLVNN